MSAWDGPDWRALKPLSTEQGDVETEILSALGLTSEELNEGERKRLTEVLDWFAAALERVERERDNWQTQYQEQVKSHERHVAVKNMEVEIVLARAEKAERALAENKQAWEDMRAYNIRLEERAREAERALAEIARLSPFVSPEDDNSIRKAPAIARAALRSEDISDES